MACKLIYLLGSARPYLDHADVFRVGEVEDNSCRNYGLIEALYLSCHFQSLFVHSQKRQKKNIEQYSTKEKSVT